MATLIRLCSKDLEGRGRIVDERTVTIVGIIAGCVSLVGFMLLLALAFKVWWVLGWCVIGIALIAIGIAVFWMSCVILAMKGE